MVPSRYNNHVEFATCSLGAASAVKTPGMNGKVVVREGESVSRAIRRLAMMVRHATKRQFSKSRPGCYEKPSYLRRQKETLRQRNARGARHRTSRESRNTVYLS